jgi:hypothetical protein
MGLGAIDGTAVVGAIRLAAARTGVDFSYLMAQARIESGLDPRAAAPTSSARGLFQFTQATWLEMVRRHGDAHGLGDAAATLRRGASPDERAAILDLRHDAGASSAMAAAFAHDNAAVLERRMGRTANATDLYLAHFLGPAGATRFLRARDAAPDAAAAGAVLPAAARANAGVFTAAGGRARSLDEVYARFAAKLAVTTPMRPPGGTALPPTGTDLPLATNPAAAARTAYLLLAELGA